MRHETKLSVRKWKAEQEVGDRIQTKQHKEVYRTGQTRGLSDREEDTTMVETDRKPHSVEWHVTWISSSNVDEFS